MKQYEEVYVDVILLKANDIVVESGGIDYEDEEGHGSWGL